MNLVEIKEVKSVNREKLQRSVVQKLSDFVDRFSEQIQNNRETIRQDLNQQLDRELLEEIQERFKEIFSEENIEEKQDFRIMATDAGRNDIELKNSTRIYILQAATADNQEGIFRAMDVGTLRSFSQQDYEKFMQRGSELQEVKSLLETLEEKPPEEKTYILIDGTLLTRLLVVPEPFNLSEGRKKRLELIDKFMELLRHAEEDENIVLAGVSKDSNSSILYRKLLGDLIEKEVKSLEMEESEEVDTEDQKFLLENYEKIRYSPDEIRTSLENLKDSGLEEKKVDKIRRLIEQYRTRFSDTELIEEMTSEKGFTDPLRIGRIKPDFFSAMEKYRKNQDYLEKTFPEVYREEGRQFIQKYSKALDKLLKAPGVVSIYYKPAENDSALRIDLLNHDLDGKRLMKCEKQVFVQEGEKIQDILELLETGYAGEGMHNVWISQADNSASLKNSDIENIYKPVLSKNLGINLRNYMRRRDKRV